MLQILVLCMLNCTIIIDIKLKKIIENNGIITSLFSLHKIKAPEKTTHTRSITLFFISFDCRLNFIYFFPLTNNLNVMRIQKFDWLCN